MDKMKHLQSNRRGRGNFGGILIILLLAVLIGGVVALSFVDVPAPTTRIEQIVPNDRSPAA